MDNDTISSPGHFSDRTFFVTPAVKRFFSLLSVINIDSLIVCLQMTHLLFILLLCSGKLPLRCAAKISVYSKNCGLPFLTDRSGNNTRSIILLLPHNICDLILTSYQNVQFICTLAATPRSLPTQPVTPRSMVIGLLPGFTCQPSSSMPLLPFTLGLGASPLTL